MPAFGRPVRLSRRIVKAVAQLIKVNVLAMTMLSLAAAPRFIARDRGAIVNLGSLIAFKASPFALPIAPRKPTP